MSRERIERIVREMAERARRLENSNRKLTDWQKERNAWERERRRRRDEIEARVDASMAPLKAMVADLLEKCKRSAEAWKMVDDGIERAQGKSEVGARNEQRRARGAALMRRSLRWARVSTRILTDEAIARAQAKCRAPKI